MVDMKMISIEEHEKYEQEHSALEESESQWYFSREEIEKSASREEIDLRKAIYYQRSYSTFLQDLGMRLAHPQKIIATAITLCHRFFHRQSHKKHDRTVNSTIAIACMILSGKAEDKQVLVDEVLGRSYEILSRKDREFKKKNKQVMVFVSI
ncbi:cyclin-T1-5-like [Cryptomeria japonica]|uniref:cyclin-T1-5-like n=1 Tax=Cryptomeria japonica TaxID=3369 RepID=UPI0027DA71EC|nr:cyclin-T1-5-like [Cryptomeria japonica]